MKIVLYDYQNLCDPGNREYTQRRLFFGLARFAFRVNTAVIDFSRENDNATGNVRCQIQVEIEGHSLVTTTQLAADVQQSAALAVDAIEAGVARQIDGRRWIGHDGLGDRFAALLRPGWLFSTSGIRSQSS